MRRDESPGRENHCGFKSRQRYLICPGAKWKTTMSQKHVPERACGFKSRPGYLLSADMQKEFKQAVRKTVAFGPCRFKSCSADYAADPQMVEELFGRLLVGDTGLRVRPPPVALYGDVC